MSERLSNVVASISPAFASRLDHKLQPTHGRANSIPATLCCADAAVASCSAILSSCVLEFSGRLPLSLLHNRTSLALALSLGALAPTVICPSMRHQATYRTSYTQSIGHSLRAAFLSWVYAAGLFGLILTICLFVVPLLLHIVPPPAMLAAEWMSLFFSLGLIGILSNRILSASIGSVSVSPRRPASRAVIGDAMSRVVVTAFLQQAHHNAAEPIVAMPFAMEDSNSTVEYLRTRNIRRVFVASGDQPLSAVLPLLRSLSTLPISVRLVPDLSEFAALSHQLGCQFGIEDGIPVLEVSDPPLSMTALVVKRIEDIAFATTFLVLLAPLLLCCMAAVKLESPGPVFFRQPRQGFNDKTFDVLKLRTMRTNAEDRFATQQSRMSDPRFTRVGTFLRRHSLDELPQLLNVLIGDMSLVGPRPHALGTTAAGAALHDVVEHYAARHRVKPGITGWAQINGWRGNLDSVEKAVRRTEHDLFYIENWSILFDLKIIFRTISLIIHDPNAF